MAIITGDADGSVVEAGGVANGTAGTPADSGNLDYISDNTFATDDTWTPVPAGTGTDFNYGTYELSATGVWTYTLDDDDAAVQALNVGQTLTDTFTVSTPDATPQQVTIIINGANDAAV